MNPPYSLKTLAELLATKLRYAALSLKNQQLVIYVDQAEIEAANELAYLYIPMYIKVTVVPTLISFNASGVVILEHVHG